MRRLILSACVLLACAAHADPLKSPACGQALAQFQAAHEARAPGAESLRQNAARVCLGLAELPQQPRSNRWAQQPIAVPPPVIEPRSYPPSPVAITPKPIPPAVHIERPPTVTSCDTNGCWAGDGSRLQRMGPSLIGPHGACTVQGASVTCP